MREQRPHRGIVAVALLELDREAFAQVSRTDAGRIEGLQHAEHRFDLRQRRAELLGDTARGRRSDSRPRRRYRSGTGRSCGAPGRRSRAQAARPGDRPASPRPTRRLRDCSRRPRVRPRRRRPIPNRPRARLCAGRAGASAASGNTFSMPVSKRILDRRGAVHVRLGPVALRSLGGALARPPCAPSPGWLGSPGALGRALQQRIALELAFHIGRQIEIGELQQLDGLHQLRRHHERLALPEFESLRERHVALQYWSGSCLSRYRLPVHPAPILIAAGVNKATPVPKCQLHAEFFAQIQPAHFGVVDDLVACGLRAEPRPNR